MSDAPHGPQGANRHLRTEHLESDLEGRAIRGGLATVVAQGVKLVLQVAAVVILAARESACRVPGTRYALVGTRHMHPRLLCRDGPGR